MLAGLSAADLETVIRLLNHIVERAQHERVKPERAQPERVKP